MMQFFKMRCWQRLLNISNKDHVPIRVFAKRSKQLLENITCKKIQAAIGKYYELLRNGNWGALARLQVFWLSKDDSTGQSARKKKKKIRMNRDELC